MKMRESFKRAICLLLAIICIATVALPVFTPINTVFADDYVHQDTSDDDTKWYIIEGEQVADLFDFSITDAIKGAFDGTLFEWITTFKTFTVIKEATDTDGSTYYKAYFNTPNLQSLAKNILLSSISEGYNYKPYDVNTTKRFVDVGDDAYKENPSVMTKYGFKIPNNVYMGEYPRELMSVAGILPTGFWEGLWRFIKSLFGFSFINAPDARNYETITYLNATYKDEKTEALVDLLRQYYIPYFRDAIASVSVTGCKSGYNGDYFLSPQDFKNQMIPDSKGKAAESWLTTNGDQCRALLDKQANPTIIEKGHGVNMTNVSSVDALVAFASSQIGLSREETYYVINNTIRFMSGQPCSSWYWLVEKDEETNTYNWDDYYKFGAFGEYSYPSYAYIYYCVASKYVVKAYNHEGAESTLINYDYYLNNPTFYEILCSAIEFPDTRVTDVRRIDEGTYYARMDMDNNGYDPYTVFAKRASQFNYATNEEEVTDNPEFYGVIYNYNEGSLYALLSPDQKRLLEQYAEKTDLVAKWTAFLDKAKLGDDSYNKLYYRQCLIESEDDAKCESKKYGDGTTTLSITQVYVLSGLYKITENKYNYDKKLTRADAIRILNRIKEYTGPYYSEVMSNMLICMSKYAEKNNLPKPELNKVTDRRVMPYDRSTMIDADKKNYTVADPRVKIYKDSFLGGLLTNFEWNWHFFHYFKPQTFFVNLSSFFCELAVYIQKIMNFDKFDEWGLSPADMWKNSISTTIIILLSVFTIIKIVIAIYKYVVVGNETPKHIFGIVLILILEIGLISAFCLDSERTWGIVKNVGNAFVNAGENMSPLKQDDSINALMGDDNTTIYYLPYFDSWTKFNTGHGLLTDEQKIILDANKYPETYGLSYSDPNSVNCIAINHKNGIKYANYWSVMLADSFSKSGYNELNTISTVGGETYNIDKNKKNYDKINTNAYRVVDHFMAPRVTITKLANNNLRLTTTSNENYNGQFQNGFLGLVPKLLCSILAFYLSIIKFMIFLWFWFMMYVFIFKILLARTVEQKPWKELLMETIIVPLGSMTIVGIASGIFLYIGMSFNTDKDAFVGIILEMVLFLIVNMFIKKWHQSKYFPKTLEWVYMLADLRRSTMNLRNGGLTRRARGTSVAWARHGVDISTEEAKNLDNLTKRLFIEPTGDMNPTYDYEVESNRELYERWEKEYIIRERAGIATAYEKLCYQNLGNAKIAIAGKDEVSEQNSAESVYSTDYNPNVDPDYEPEQVPEREEKRKNKKSIFKFK